MLENNWPSERFIVALSCPSEIIPFVEKVANLLESRIGNRNKIFFYRWYESDLSGKSGDLKLKKIYEQMSDLVVPFFSQESNKVWCQFEWECIRSRLLSHPNDDSILLIKMDDCTIPGWNETDFHIKFDGRSPEDIAEIILNKLKKFKSFNKNLNINEILDKNIREGFRSPIIYNIFKSECKEKKHSLISMSNILLPKLSIENLVARYSNNSQRPPLVLTGDAGSGVSTILSTLYSLMREQEVNCAYFDISAYSAPPSQKDYGLELESILKQLVDYLINNDGYFTIIVDGIDETIPSRDDIYDVITENVAIKNTNWIYGVRGLRVKTQQFGEDSEILEIHPLSINDSEATKLIENFSITVGVNSSDIFSVFQKFGCEQVDMFWLYIAFRGLQNRAIFNCLSSILFGYIADLAQCHIGRSKSRQRIENILKLAGRFAFEEFVRVKTDSDGEFDVDDKAIDNTQNITLSRNKKLALELISAHPVINKFLIAYHIIGKYKGIALKTEDNSNVPDLPFVYPYTVNLHCRDMIQDPSNKEIQRDIVKSARIVLMSGVDDYMKANTCYLLGRVTKHPYISQAIELLNKVVNSSWLDSTKDKKALMFARSAYISLAYLGEKNKTREYCGRLLNSSAWDQFNRGFHLEYYGDRSYSPEEPLESLDDLGDCQSTFSKLISV